MAVWVSGPLSNLAMFQLRACRELVQARDKLAVPAWASLVRARASLVRARASLH